MEQQINNAPGGLTDHDYEFFVMNGRVNYIHDGKMHSWEELTLDAATVLRAQLDNDEKALMGIQAMGITDPKDQLEQYVFCNFGEFSDQDADIDEGGTIHREYWNCGSRETCRGHGLVCKFPEVPNGKLTNNDTRLMKAITCDLANKEIADIFHRSVHTINRECKTIAAKLGCISKPGIAAFAACHNIN
jgi:DNA-binding CsgD family transcriptional regulator